MPNMQGISIWRLFFLTLPIIAIFYWIEDRNQQSTTNKDISQKKMLENQFHLIAKNQQQLKWLYVENQNGFMFESQFLSLYYSDGQKPQQIKKIQYKLNNTKGQIKAVSQTLSCVLVYYSYQKTLQTVRFYQQSTKSYTQQIFQKELLEAASLNFSQFKISNDCMRIRLKSYVYQFDIELNDYVKTNQISKKWNNPIFNQNMRYAVDDIGIHTYKPSQKKYQLMIRKPFLKNKRVWTQGKKMVVFSWEESTTKIFYYQYEVKIFKVNMLNQTYNIIKEISGQFRSQLENQSPKIIVSQDLQTIILSVRQDVSQKLVNFGIKVDYVNNSVKLFQIPQYILNLSSGQIRFINNFIYFIRDDVDKQIIDLFQIYHKKLFWFNQTIIEMKGDEIFNKYEYQDQGNVLKISKFTYEDGKMKVYQKLIQLKDQELISIQQGYTKQVIFLLFLCICFIMYLWYINRTQSEKLLILFLCVGFIMYLRRITNQIIQQETQKNDQQLRQIMVKQQLKQHLKVLNIPQSVAQKFQQLQKDLLRSQFRKAMNQLSLSQQNNQQIQHKRIQINKAYEVLCQKIHQTQFSLQQNILMNILIQENIIQLKSYLTLHPQFINHRFKGSNYPLIYIAVRTGCYQTVQLILKMGCSLNFKNDLSTPMHCAAHYGYHQIICLLLLHGVPVNILNKSNHLPIQEAATKDIQKLITDADKDNIHKLIQQLIDQKLCLSTFNFKKNQKVIARKVILHNSKLNFDGYEDAFHGTKFQNLKSIAKHSLKKIGDVVDGLKIQLVDGHSKDKKWGEAVFVSPSLLYAGCSVYAKQIINTTNKNTEVWLPVVQVKIKKQSYSTCKSTVSSYVYKDGEPQEVQYRIEMNTEKCREKIAVVALLLVQKAYLDSIQNYSEIVQMFLTKKDQKLWLNCLK